MIISIIIFLICYNNQGGNVFLNYNNIIAGKFLTSSKKKAYYVSNVHWWFINMSPLRAINMPSLRGCIDWTQCCY